MSILKLIDIKKNFDKTEVLKGLNLEVSDSEVYGLLGPNGVGKTTAIHIMLGLISQTSGQILMNNSEINAPYPGSIKLGFGYIPDEPILMPYLTAVENMELISYLYQISSSKKLIEDCLDKFNLLDVKNKIAKEFSKGMKQKLMLASQLLHNPSIVIMDEPTIGLDPVSNSQLKDMIKSFRDDGKSVIITSHDMAFAEKICDRVGILIDGKILFEGTISSIKNFANKTNLEDSIVSIIENNIVGVK